MENNSYISPSPHTHGGDSISRNMHDVLITLILASLVSLYSFGLGALIATVVSILACMTLEYLTQRLLMRKEPTLCDGPAILTDVLLVFNLPSNPPVWITIIGALAAIGIGEMSFGELGNNILNPALVGRVLLLIPFPAQMTAWPVVDALSVFLMTCTDAQTGATILSLIDEGVTEPPSYGNMLVRAMGGSLGEVSVVALILGLLFMLWKKIITWQIPVSILVTAFVFMDIMYLVNPVQYASPFVHLSFGGLLLGSIFMATDHVTSPMSKSGMFVYGVGIGILTTVTRLSGSYPEGMSFTILITNAFISLINSYIKSKHFGGK